MPPPWRHSLLGAWLGFQPFCMSASAVCSQGLHSQDVFSVQGHLYSPSLVLYIWPSLSVAFLLHSFENNVKAYLYLTRNPSGAPCCSESLPLPLCLFSYYASSHWTPIPWRRSHRDCLGCRINYQPCPRKQLPKINSSGTQPLISLSLLLTKRCWISGEIREWVFWEEMFLKWKELNLIQPLACWGPWVSHFTSGSQFPHMKSEGIEISAS